MKRLRDFDLKMPEMKVPAVLSDLFYDLRERRLLPLVALLGVALIAVPILLSESGSESDHPPTASAPEAGAAKAREVSQLTVVETDQGLRRPEKRLGHRSPQDPFVQQYTGPVNGGAEVTQTATSETSTSTTTPTEAGSETGGAAPAAPPTSTSPTRTPPDDEITIFTFAVDLKIVKTTTDADGKKAKDEPETRERVLPSTTLPGKKAQVVTYMGISPKTKKPLFMVSADVTSIFGEAECLAGAASCQLLELEEDFPITFLYGPNDVRYKITVLDIEPLVTGHL